VRMCADALWFRYNTKAFGDCQGYISLFYSIFLCPSYCVFDRRKTTKYACISQRFFYLCAIRTKVIFAFFDPEVKAEGLWFFHWPADVAAVWAQRGSHTERPGF